MPNLQAEVDKLRRACQAAYAETHRAFHSLLESRNASATEYCRTASKILREALVDKPKPTLDDLLDRITPENQHPEMSLTDLTLERKLDSLQAELDKLRLAFKIAKVEASQERSIASLTTPLDYASLDTARLDRLEKVLEVHNAAFTRFGENVEQIRLGRVAPAVVSMRGKNLRALADEFLSLDAEGE